jgi:hypothetical protein
LERILTALKEASCQTNGDVEYELSVTMDMSDSKINWEKSILPKGLFEDKFDNIKKICNWCNVSFDINQNKDCFGCADKRRNDSVKYRNKCDAFVWLDPDIYFPKHILTGLGAAVNGINNKYYLVTPEIIRYWDSSWDVITNKKFLSEPFNHRDFFDMYSVDAVCQELDGPSIEPLQENVIKFGGGWFTCISHDLLQLATVPSFIGEYGPDDTWLSAFSSNYNIKHSHSIIKQYVMRNIVTTELGKTYISENPYKKYLKLNIIDIEAHKDKIWKEFGNKLQEHISKTQ